MWLYKISGRAAGRLRSSGLDLDLNCTLSTGVYLTTCTINCDLRKIQLVRNLSEVKLSISNPYEQATNKKQV